MHGRGRPARGAGVVRAVAGMLLGALLGRGAGRRRPGPAAAGARLSRGGPERHGRRIGLRAFRARGGHKPPRRRRPACRRRDRVAGGGGSRDGAADRGLAEDGSRGAEPAGGFPAAGRRRRGGCPGAAGARGGSRRRRRRGRRSGWRCSAWCSTPRVDIAAFGPGLVAWLPGARPGFSAGRSSMSAAASSAWSRRSALAGPPAHGHRRRRGRARAGGGRGLRAAGGCIARGGPPASRRRGSLTAFRRHGRSRVLHARHDRVSDGARPLSGGSREVPHARRRLHASRACPPGWSSATGTLAEVGPEIARLGRGGRWCSRRRAMRRRRRGWREDLGPLAAGVFAGAAMHTPVEVTEAALAGLCARPAPTAWCRSAAARPSGSARRSRSGPAPTRSRCRRPTPARR